MTSVPLRGSCQCGQVTYEATEAPALVLVCHCIDCQKLSASAWSPTLVIRAKSLEVKGNLGSWERTTTSGRRNIGYFCTQCGCRIFHEDPDQPHFRRLKGGTLDNGPIPTPVAHVWVSRKQPWVEIPEGVPQFEENLPPDAAKKLFAKGG
ncbi:MAG: GFA family protein [Gammaproteobacteria bacterium]|nr:GFA family protein [Gammaproteobacteria bacterium]